MPEPCKTKGCKFLAHSNMPFHPMWSEANKKQFGDAGARHCCHKCMTGKGHGMACQKQVIPKAAPAKKEGFTYDRMGNSISNDSWICPKTNPNRMANGRTNPED